MNILIKAEQTIFDLQLQVEGKCNTNTLLFIDKYGLIGFEYPNGGRTIDLTYNLLNDISKSLYLNKKSICTGSFLQYEDNYKLLDIDLSAFDEGYSVGFES